MMRSLQNATEMEGDARQSPRVMRSAGEVAPAADAPVLSSAAGWPAPADISPGANDTDARALLAAARRELQFKLGEVDAFRVRFREADADIVRLRAEREHAYHVLNAERSAASVELDRLRDETARALAGEQALHAVVGQALVRLAQAITIEPEAQTSRLGPESAQVWRVTSLEELLGLPDDEFVQQAYLALLGRMPEPEERSHSIAALETGKRRLAILRDIHGAAEGRTRGVTLPGLRAALAESRGRAAEGGRSDLRDELAALQTEITRLAEAVGAVKAREAMLAQRLGLVGEVLAQLHAAVHPDWEAPVEPAHVRLGRIADDSEDAAAMRVELGGAMKAIASDSGITAGGRVLEAVVATTGVPETAGGPPELIVGFDLKAGLPQDMLDRLNAGFLGVGCLTEQARRIAVDEGLSIPVAAVGFGVDHWERVAGRARPELPAKGVRFIHVCRNPREDGTDLTLSAFGRAFRTADAVSLVLVCAAEAEGNVREQIGRLRAEDDAFPDVHVVAAPPSQAELRSLLEACHILVMPVRTGGFGEPIALAALAGLPVIATAWGGHRDYCDDGNGWSVDYDFVRSEVRGDHGRLVWAEPKAAALVEALTAASEMAEAERVERGRAGRERILRAFSWKSVARKVIHLGEAAARGASAKPKRIGWISTWNTKCGIATNLKHQIDAIDQNSSVILAPRNAQLIRDDDTNCFRAWNLGKNGNSFDKTLQVIESQKIKVVIIHFNYGFFNHFELSKFIVDMCQKNIIVMIILHATLDPGQDANLRLDTMREGLSKCHRILVHNVTDLNNLKKLGLVDNVALLAHGVQVIEKGRDWSKFKTVVPRLVSFGFCLPNKGLRQLIEAVSILRDKGTPVSLLMLNAEYPHPSSTEEIGSIRSLIAQRQLDNLIDFRTEFIEDDEIFRLMDHCDVLVNPYQHTMESASGSVRFGLGSGLPVIVTPLSIFEDLEDIVFRTSGTSSEEIADGIKQVLDELANQTQQVVQTKAASERWLEAHDFRRQGPRIVKIGNALHHDLMLQNMFEVA